MILKIILTVVFACLFAFASGATDLPVSQPEPDPHPITHSSPVSPNTTTTPTTPTTPTTHTPTTTKATTTSSSPITSPTTTQKPTPRPTPKPDVGKWNITDKIQNVTCILAEMAIQFNVTYITVDNKTEYGILDVPKNSSATGSCGNESQVINLTWSNSDNTTNELSIVFKKNSTDSRFMVGSINLTVTPSDEIFPSIKDKNVTSMYSNKNEFSTPLSKSYRCAKEQAFGLIQNGSNNTVGTIELSHVQLEAFHKKMDDLFGAAEDCEGGSSPDIVPIAVGCALVGLVAIVLIAYLVGRRRSQARGYLSM